MPQLVAEASVPSADLTLQEARSLRLQGNPTGGLQRLAAIDPVSCSDRNAYSLEKGECEFALSQWLQTLNTLTQAVNAGSAAALRLSGIAASRQKDWPLAVTHLRRYTAQKTDDPEAWRELGHALFTQGQYADALSAARQAFQLTPTVTEAASLLAQSLIMNRRYEEALEICSHFPQGILSPEFLAHLLIEAGMLEQAAAHINKWVDAQPNNFLAWMALGGLDERMNEPENARQHYQQALNLRSDFHPAAESLRRVEHQLGYAEW